jgi:hypothetical protein
MVWDGTDTSIVRIGSAASKITATVTAVSANKACIIDVTSDFSDGESVTIYGLKFTNSATGTDNLELSVDGDSTTEATDDKDKVISGPKIDSETAPVKNNGDAKGAAPMITITDGTSAVITAANDVRIRIPTATGMRWDATDTAVTIGGTASAKVNAAMPISFTTSPTETVVRVNVDANLSAGQTITVTGLTLTAPTSVSTADKLELVTDGSDAGTTSGLDGRIHAVGPPKIEMSSITVTSSNTSLNTVTITDTNGDLNITDDLRLVIPIDVNLKWNTDQSAATVTAGGSTLAASYNSIEDLSEGNKVLFFTVTANSTSGDTLTISNLKVDLDNAASSVTFNDLMISADGPGTINAASVAGSSSSGGGGGAAVSSSGGGGEFIESTEGASAGRWILLLLGSLLLFTVVCLVRAPAKRTR